MVRVIFLRLLLGVALLATACGSDAGEDSGQAMTEPPSATQPEPSPEPATLSTTGTASPTECAPNPEWRDVYQVQPGDTLGAIAIAAGLTIKELQDGNCLEDRDLLYVGQELRVPNAFSIGLITSPVGVSGVVIFVRRDAQGAAHLWTVRSDGSALRQITRDEPVVGGAVRAPDLERVALRRLSPYYSDETISSPIPTDIYTVRVDGTGLQQVVDQGPRMPVYRSVPAWSPDSAHLAFTEHSGAVGSLVVVAADGTERTVVLTGDFSPPDSSEPVAPSWSPDGETLAGMRWEPEDGATLFVTPARARSEQVVTLLSGFDYVEGPYWLADQEATAVAGIALAVMSDVSYQVEWLLLDSESGHVVARKERKALASAASGWYVEFKDAGAVLGTTDVPAADVDALLPDSFAAMSWGPEGVQLVVSRGKGGLFVVDLAAGIEERITDGDDMLPVWTPVGWRLLP